MAGAHGDIPTTPGGGEGTRGTADLSASESVRLPLVIGERPGDSIGTYRLLSVLGEGGFGVVFLAERREPFVQRVALKVIKPGMDSRAVLARFEQERQALAVMDHPNVAKVLDGGVTASGRPYFVMEHVAGEALTDYCDRENLTIRRRLELFIPVCEAVQHAHMKGIIHRDLKPSNVLVSVKDRQPIPKVIDFGVAKAISHTLTEKTVFTEQGVLIGTPEYMSPEQAEMGATDIDTRTDVYSLGVMLYQLLTGALPFDNHELRRAAFIRIQQIIREVDPPKPSTRLTSLGAEGAGVAAHRRTRLDELARELRRELDWVPLKAMRKDRTRRYQTAAALAADLRNYLNERPLEAAPERAAYRARKFVQRHRGPVAAAAAVALALTAGLAATTWAMLRARRAEAAARAERDIAARTVAFLNDDLLGAADSESADPQIRLVTLIDRAAETGPGPDAAPVVAARIAYSLGRSYLALGLPAQAEAQLRRGYDLQLAAAAAGDEMLTEIGARLGEALYRQGRAGEAAELLRPIIAAREAAAGADDPTLLNAKHQLGGALKWLGEVDEAAAVYGEVLRRRSALPAAGHHDAMITRFNLALVGLRRAEIARGAGAAEGEVSRLLSAAAADMLAVWTDCRRLLGDDNRWTLGAASEYASLLNRLGRLDEAAPIYESTIPLMKRRLGERSWRTIEACANWARLRQKTGDHAGAARAYEEVLPLYREVRGRTFPDTVVVCVRLVESLAAAGEAENAGRVAEEGWADLISDGYVDPPRKLQFAQGVVRAFEAAGRPADAARWADRAAGRP